MGAGNLSTRSGATAFADSTLPNYPQHRVEYLNDGIYGNEHSWISNAKSSPAAGIDLGGMCRVDAIAFGRNNGGKTPHKDRCDGIYTIQYTTEPNPRETDATQWRVLGTVQFDSRSTDVLKGEFKPWQRHRFRFNPVLATGVRLVMSKPGICIDELEVYGTSLADDSGSLATPAAVIPAQKP